MTAKELFKSIKSMGCSVTLAGDFIKITPKNALNQEIREAIIQHKADLMNLL